MSIGRQLICRLIVLIPVFVCLSVAASSLCETLEFSVPVLGNFGTGSFTIDLGGPVASVTSVSVRMSGVATFAEYAQAPGDSVLLCDNSVDVPMDFSISVRSADGVAWYHWLQSENGPFAIEDDMRIDEWGAGLLRDGIGSIAYADLHNVAVYINECPACPECRRGGTWFDSYPVVTIQYDLAVSGSVVAWGGVKARYK